MNENLHHLLDGELPDTTSAELFRSLSESQEQRQLFREQVKLQGALYRNECHGAMTADEEMDMLARIDGTIGAGAPAAGGRRIGPLALALLGVFGLLIGTGVGYLAGGGFNDTQQSAVSPAPAIEKPVVATPRAELPPPINRDSLVAAIRDSLVKAMTPAPAQSTSKKKVRSSRRSSGDNDPTGSAAAKRLAKKKQSESSN